MKQQFLTLLIWSTFLLSAQNQTGKINLFYDCQTYQCEVSYLKQNLKGVEFVRDRNFADVHIIVLSEKSGSGGQKYIFKFQGQNKFKDIAETYKFSIGADSTKEEFRKKLLQYIQLGLVRFWYKSGLADKLSIKLNLNDKDKQAEDKWHNWVFKVGGHAWFNGDSNSNNRNITGYAKASKVQEKNKFSFSLRYNTGKSQYKFNNQTITSLQEYFELNLYQVWGINQHWSYGLFGNFNRSKFRNYDRSIGVYGGVEYNFFPYKESASKSLVITTKLGSVFNKYFEKTVYNKTEEQLWQAKVLLNGNIVKKWGSLYAGVDYQSYLYDLSLYAVGFNLGTNLRLAKGLELNTNAYYGIQHDQINIAAGNLSLEEILLAQKQLQSGYDYYFSVGLSYSFGSIYNSIVNPRFDSDSGGSRSCYCF